ncbi:hypothetical protein SLS62_006843 [Diatrype stigma]|uniref:Uncharacterized protein n=1 Tax=Diatrype stigma TaxID=117547 RepID=A0AAN9YR91_9PEZI
MLKRIPSGGIPVSPNIHGLTADNVRDFEVTGKVILSDCSVLNANSESLPDFRRASKGDGRTLVRLDLVGSVASFDFKTSPLTKTRCAVYLYDPADYVNILQDTIEVQKSMESDPNIGLFVSFNLTFVAVGSMNADTLTDILGAFDPFLNLKSLMTVAVPWTDGTIGSLIASIQYDATSAR